MSVDGFFFQAEDGIRDLVRSRGLGDVYKRQGQARSAVLTLNGEVSQSTFSLGCTKPRLGASVLSRSEYTLSLIHI